MDRAKKKRLAKSLYVQMGMTQKGVAEKVGVTENTLSKWAKQGNWKQLREAKQLGPDQLEVNVRSLLSMKIERKLELEQEVRSGGEVNAKEMTNLVNEIGYLQKLYSTTKRDNSIPLHVHLQVLTQYHEKMRAVQPKLYAQLMDFEEAYIDELAGREL